ncbi:hypothetical protein JG688_00003060 [Phytophthora aleatoria]|uniref:Uncharacterized protein n=1 Tax=Phytophthora aleatoria TaxID=2496075 RepID=A0A8J5IZY4_9STRA|nr:hypothetical protein JG688_00003060 [Phytophthora aleatoria]
MSLAVLAVLSALWAARAFFLARMVADALGFLFLALLEAEEGVPRSVSSRVTPVFQILAMGLAPQSLSFRCSRATKAKVGQRCGLPPGKTFETDKTSPIAGLTSYIAYL